MKSAKPPWTQGQEAPGSPLLQALRRVGRNLLPGLFVFPILGIVPWLLGYRMTGSMVILAGALGWLGFPPDQRSVRTAAESALFLGVASFILEVTLWRGK